MTTSSGVPVRARFAVATFFFVNGMVLASWVPHIPAVKTRHDIGDGALGAVLLCMGIGAIVALPVAGWLVERFGSRRTTTLAGLGLCLALPGPVVSPTLPLTCLSLLVLGACNGVLDVSMNAQAVTVEAQYGRPIMSSFHALFSLAGLVGAALAGTAMRLGSADAAHVVAMGVLAFGLLATASRGLVPTVERAPRGPVFVRPTGVLLGLGVLAFCGLLAEGAMGDWSAVYLRDVLSAPADVAAAGFAAFSLAMAAGRFGGDVLARRLGPARLLRASGVVAAAGLVVGLLADAPVGAIAGFGVVGLGVANIVPVLFSSAGRVPGVPAGTAIAAVATTGYLGFLAGPPAIGLVADATTLSVGLGVVCAACVLIAVFAPLVGEFDVDAVPVAASEEVIDERDPRPLFIPVILGTVRKGRMSHPVARLMTAELARRPGVETALIDIAELPLRVDDAGEATKDPGYAAHMTRADALVIVSPEYNHGYSGLLKHVLDSCLKEYIHKAVGVVGVSAGPWGGTRGIQDLLPVLRELGLVTIFWDLNFASVQNVFDESGALKDQAYLPRIDKFLKELVWMAKALRHGREQIALEDA